MVLWALIPFVVGPEGILQAVVALELLGLVFCERTNVLQGCCISHRTGEEGKNKRQTVHRQSMGQQLVAKPLELVIDDGNDDPQGMVCPSSLKYRAAI